MLLEQDGRSLGRWGTSRRRWRRWHENPTDEAQNQSELVESGFCYHEGIGLLVFLFFSGAAHVPKAERHRL